MATVYRPRKGSLNFKHKSVKGSDLIPGFTNTSLIYAVKVGMSQVQSEDTSYKPITILEVPNHNIVKYIVYKDGVKYKEITNETSEDLSKYTKLPFEIKYLVELDLPNIKSTSYNYKPIKELPVIGELKKLGFVNIDQVITPLNKVDITAISKGKGFTGVVKKYGLKLKKRKHARANKTRHIGSISSRGLGKLTRFSKQAGHMGCFRRTIHNLDLVKNTDFTNTEFKNYGVVKNKNIAIIGSIPGAVKRLVLIRTARNVN